MRLLTLAFLLTAAALIQPAQASITIDTTGAPAGTVAPFGEGNTATYGQTFVVGATNTVLDNFSFFLDDALDPDFVDFAFYVAAWDGLKATGPVLFQSAQQVTTNNGGAGGYEQFTFNTNLALTAGGTYVAFLSASNFFDGSQGLSHWPLTNGDPYPAGGFVFENNGTNFADLFVSTWDAPTGAFVEDVHFIANFSERGAVGDVPEPLSIFVWSLIGAVGGCLCLNRSR